MTNERVNREILPVPSRKFQGRIGTTKEFMTK
jgi:hypothetical protein